MKQGSVSSDEEIECLKSVWIHEQCEIREKIVEIDTCPGLTEGAWRYIGGLDISFIVGDDINAAALGCPRELIFSLIDLCIWHKCQGPL